MENKNKNKVNLFLKLVVRNKRGRNVTVFVRRIPNYFIHSCAIEISEIRDTK